MLTTENYEYRLDEERRKRIQETAAQEHLAKLAMSNPSEEQAAPSQKPARVFKIKGIRSLFIFVLKTAGLLALAAMFLVPQFSSLAQGPGALKTSGDEEPDHPALAPYRIGNYFFEQGKYEMAAAYFSDAIAKLPRFGYALAARGDCYLALGKPELAIADYTLALDVYPDYVSVYYTRGRAYHALGQIEQAAADYEKAIALMPEYAESYRGLGDLQFEQGQYERALASYQTYLEYVTGTPDSTVVSRLDQMKSQAEPVDVQG